MTNPAHLALVRPKKGATNFRGVIMPYKPPVDKIAALFILLHNNATPIEDIRYWTANECPDEQFTAWRDEGYYPVDIGDRKYHQAGVGSATAFVVKEFGIDLGPAFVKLVEMINKNNKTGYLKNQKFAVPHILRELYELSDDEAFHIEVINRSAHVIEAFTRVEGGKVAQSVEGLEDVLPNWVATLSASQYGPLTLGRYMRDLWILGEEPAAIVERLRFWTSNWDRVQAELARGFGAVEKLKPREWDVAGTKAMFLHTDDHFIAKAAIKSRRWGIRVIIKSNGHTVVSTNGLDLSKMHKVLEQREPGRWYYQAKMGALINGGPQYVGVEPTSIPPDGLINMMKVRLEPKKK